MKRREFLSRLVKTAILYCGGSYFGAPAWAAPTGVISKLAFGACCKQNDAQPVWNAIAAAKPDLFVFLGDNIYADTEDMTVMKAKYEKLGANPDFSRFRTKTRIVATWDDHDYGVDDAGAEYPKKEESKDLMLNFFGEPKDSERRKRPGVYTSYQFGPQGQVLQLILLDLRWFRSKLQGENRHYVPSPDERATMMGDAQWQWLEEELKKPADLRIIASSIQFVSPDHDFEKWANLPHEKQKMMDLLDRLHIDNAIFISGDAHHAELSAEKTAKGTTLFDLTSSGLNTFLDASHRQNRYRIFMYDKGPQFGFVEIDWSKKPLSVSLQVRTETGRIVLLKDVVMPSASG